MNQITPPPTAAEPVESVDGVVMPLSRAKPGQRGTIVAVSAEVGDADRGVDAQELLRRLLEFGFVEGACVEVLHEGAIGADPIAVRLDDMRVALRRRDAADVRIRLDLADA